MFCEPNFNDTLLFFLGESSQPNKKVREGYICKICNQPGHYIQDCPLKVCFFKNFISLLLYF